MLILVGNLAMLLATGFLFMTTLRVGRRRRLATPIGKSAVIPVDKRRI